MASTLPNTGGPPVEVMLSCQAETHMHELCLVLSHQEASLPHSLYAVWQVLQGVAHLQVKHSRPRHQQRYQSVVSVCSETVDAASVTSPTAGLGTTQRQAGVRHNTSAVLHLHSHAMDC